MSEVALVAAGTAVFALTTWASLAFGYQVFQTMWETDQAGSPAPAQPETDDIAIPALDGGVANGEVPHQSAGARSAGPVFRS